MKTTKKSKIMLPFSIEQTLKAFSRWLTSLKLAINYEWFPHHTLTKMKAFTAIWHTPGKKLEKHWREAMQVVGNFMENNLKG